jgi:biotin/methionine sulfoxide reductase
MWAQTQQRAATLGHELPDWETFMQGGVHELADPAPEQVFLADFRANPEAHRLPTPSGRIELVSNVIAGFGYEDCPKQATWFAPRRATGDYPLALISGQPATRLHSQLDNGDYSKSHKIKGREPVLIHPDDAKSRGISDGDLVELRNDKGRCLAGARVTSDVAQGVVFLWTGAWYDPDYDHPDHRDRHGNPNVLTHDLRTSRLSQGPASHSANVEISLIEGEVEDVKAHEPPSFVPRNSE